ncbi:hypothetical protein [Micromonospora sp. NPDC023737]|uniref:hypothetical protein n=1 Tax=unclassified Micromonospora TaxID=2617518 RepID=UPI0033EDD845
MLPAPAPRRRCGQTSSFRLDLDLDHHTPAAPWRPLDEAFNLAAQLAAQTGETP